MNDTVPSTTHYVNGHSIVPPWPDGARCACFGMGCFWGAEKLFWQTGVYATAVGYYGGAAPDPDYKAVCTGTTGHAEVVLVVYDPQTHSYPSLLRLFWEGHNPTQGLRQGNDIGSQYRSVIYTSGADQESMARRSMQLYAEVLHANGANAITTEISPLDGFYYAEDYHQQYLAKNPDGYCGIGGTRIPFPLDALLKSISE